MKSAEIILLDGHSVHGTVVIDKHDAVWVTVSIPWWDFATQIWWWLAPADKKALLVVTADSGKKVRVKAVRLAKRYVRLGALAQKVEEAADGSS